MTIKQFNSYKSAYLWKLLKFYITSKSFHFQKSIDKDFRLTQSIEVGQVITLGRKIVAFSQTNDHENIFVIDDEMNGGFFNIFQESFSDVFPGKVNACLPILPSMDRILAWNSETGKILLIESNSRKMLHVFNLETTVRGICSLSNGRQFVVVTSNSIKIFEVKYERTHLVLLKSELFTFPGKSRIFQTVTELNNLVIITDGFLIKTLSLDLLEEVQSLWTRHYRPGTSICLLTDSKSFAVGFKDGVIHVYNLNLELIFNFAAHLTEITALLLYPRGSYLVSSCRNGTVKIWCLETKKLFKGTQCKEVVTCQYRDHVGFYILSPGELVTLKFNHIYDLVGYSSHEISQIKKIDCIRRRNLIGLILSGKIVKILRESDLSEVFSFQFANKIHDYCYAFHAGTLSVIDEFGDFKMTNTEGIDGHGNCGSDFTCMISYEMVDTSLTSPEFVSLVICGKEDGVIQMFDCRNPRGLFNVVSHEGQRVEALSPALKGRRIISSGRDKSIRIWHVGETTLTNLHSIFCEGSPTWLSVISIDLCASIYAENEHVTTFLLDLRNTNKIMSSFNESLKGTVLSVATCPRLRIYATLCSDNVITVWNCENNCVRKIVVSESATCICFVNSLGDMLISQENSLWLIKANNYLPLKYQHKRATIFLEKKLETHNHVVTDDIRIVEKYPCDLIDRNHVDICLCLGETQVLEKEYARLIDRNEDILMISEGKITPSRIANRLSVKRSYRTVENWRNHGKGSKPRQLPKIEVERLKSKTLTFPNILPAIQASSSRGSSAKDRGEPRLSSEREWEDVPIFIEFGDSISVNKDLPPTEEHSTTSEYSQRMPYSDPHLIIPPTKATSLVDPPSPRLLSPRRPHHRRPSPIRESMIIVCDIPNVGKLEESQDAVRQEIPKEEFVSVFITEEVNTHKESIHVAMLDNYREKPWCQRFVRNLNLRNMVESKMLSILMEEAKMFSSEDLCDVLDLIAERGLIGESDSGKVRSLVFCALWFHDLQDDAFLSRRVLALIAKMQLKGPDVMAEILGLYFAGDHKLKTDVIALLGKLGLCDGGKILQSELNLWNLSGKSKNEIKIFIKLNCQELTNLPASNRLRLDILGKRNFPTAIDGLNYFVIKKSEESHSFARSLIRAVIMSPNRSREPVLMRYGESHTERCGHVVPYMYSDKLEVIRKYENVHFPSIYYPMKKCTLLPFTENSFMNCTPLWLKEHFDIKETIVKNNN